MAGGNIPFLGWIVILLLIVCAGLVEYAVRQSGAKEATASSVANSSRNQTQKTELDSEWIVAGIAIGTATLLYVDLNVWQPQGNGLGIPPSKLTETWWHPLSASQTEQLTEALLKVNRGEMVIGCNYTECRLLATSLYQLFKRLGWDVPLPVGQTIDAFVEGITISPPTKEATQIATAITEVTGNKVFVDDHAEKGGPIRLNIGTKPFVQ